MTMKAPRTRLPDARSTPRFAGVCTFGRFPLIDPAAQPPDWAIYGIPFDGGVTFRPGARFGPRAVREASQFARPFHLVHKVNLIEKLSIADAGDAPVSPYHIKETLDSAAAWAGKLGDPDTTRLLAIGGDHSIAYANIRASWERRGRPAGGFGLVHFDSHLDTVDSVWGEKWGHASPFIRAIEDGLINPRHMISVGVKGPLNTSSDLEFAAKHGITVLMRESLEGTGPALLRDFVAARPDREFYLSFDVDVVDPAFAPGTGTPSIGGITSAQALSLLQNLRGIRLAGADIVEVLPAFDVSQLTALLASQIMVEILALDALRVPD
ncbi:MAG: agmatinase [Phycisphaerae bacterium]|nr:agmatinase [Phycisphaerae bacterium]